MNDERLQKLITDRLAGELSPEDRAELDAAIAKDPALAKHLDDMRELWGKVGEALAAHNDLNAEESPLTLEKIQAEANYRKAKRLSEKKYFINPKFISWLAVAACAVVISFVMIGLTTPAFRVNKLNGGEDLFYAPAKAPKVVAAKTATPLSYVEENVKQNKTVDYDKTLFTDGRVSGVGGAAADSAKPVSKSEATAVDRNYSDVTTDFASPAPKRSMRLRSSESYGLKKMQPDEKLAEVATTSAPSGPIVADQLNAPAAAPAAAPPMPVASKPKSAPSASAQLAASEMKPMKEAKKQELARKDSGSSISAGKESADVYRRKADLSKSKDSKGLAAGSKIAEASVDKVIAVEKMPAEKKEDSIKAPVEAEEKSKPVESRKFRVNLKLWDMTTEADARTMLARSLGSSLKGLSIIVDKDSGTIELKASSDVLENAEKVFNDLNKKEEERRNKEKGLPFMRTRDKPFSTFSIDVDTASYTAARKAILEGRRPVPETVRAEEFVNYFDYRYPAPPPGALFAARIESAPSVYRPGNHTLMIGVQAMRLGEEPDRPSSLTLLLDTSGSMAARDRLGLVKRAFPTLLETLRPNDRLSLITCGSGTHMLIKSRPASEKELFLKTIEEIVPDGETNIEEALAFAYKTASMNLIPRGSNRVVVITDGIVSRGSKDAEKILAHAAGARGMGVRNTIIGVGGDGDDALLSALAEKGDGVYLFVDSEDEARKVFSEQFAAAFREIASDVKIQVEFNPELVAEYRQVGYETRQLSKADFRDDKVDAGEIGAGQEVTALYEFKCGGQATSGNIATVRIRYKRSDTLEIEEREFYFDASEMLQAYDRASPAFKLATSAAEFAETLRHPETPGIATPARIAEEFSRLSVGVYANDRRVLELLSLARAVK